MDATKENITVTRGEFEAHDQRISALEQNYSALTKDLTEVKAVQFQTQNVVMQESNQQKELLNKIVDQTFELKKISVSERWKFFGQVVVALFGAGGFVTLVWQVIQALIK